MIPIQQLSNDGAGNPDYILEVFYDTCQRSNALQYRFMTASHGQELGAAAFGPNCGGFCFAEDTVIQVQLIITCTDEKFPLPEKPTAQLVLTTVDGTSPANKKLPSSAASPFIGEAKLGGEYVVIVELTNVPTPSDNFQYFYGKQLLTTVNSRGSWALKGVLEVESANEGTKHYEFDPEVIVGGGPD